jgi:hypothetical protein
MLLMLAFWAVDCHEVLLAKILREARPAMCTVLSQIIK